MTDLASKLRQSYHLDTVQPDHILRRAADEIERLSAERDALLDTLVDTIQQACYVPSDSSEVDSMALTSYADAIRLLAKHGRVEIKADVGRRVIGTWVDAATGDSND